MTAAARSRERLPGPPPIDAAVADFTWLVDRCRIDPETAAARVGWPLDTLHTAIRRDRHTTPVLRRKEAAA